MSNQFLPLPSGCQPCPEQCDPAQIPGPAGNDGKDGANGADGANAFTITIEDFVMPAVGATVFIHVGDTSWMVPLTNVGGGDVNGQVLAVEFAGAMIVIAILDGTHVQLRNDGYTGNAVAGVTIPAGARVGVAGLQGSTGATPGGAFLIVNNLSEGVAATMRGNLGLGTIATLNSPLPIANGGTAGTTAATARTNLGAATAGPSPSSGLTVSVVDRVLGRQSAGVNQPIEEIVATAFGRSLLALTGLPALEALIGLGVVPVRTESSGYSAVLTDYLILCDASGAPFSILLPAVSTANGKVFVIKKIDASSSAITVDPAGGDLIDGAPILLLGAYNDSVSIIGDSSGSSWRIV